MSSHNILTELAGTQWRRKDPGDAGTFDIKTGGIFEIETGGAETRTLPEPGRPGLIVGFSMLTDGGDCVITSSVVVNQTGNNTITLADVGDVIILLSINTNVGVRWSILVNDGAGLSTV